MYQSFSITSSPEQGPPRLKALRAVMQDRGIAAYIVPRADVHQGEYVSPRDDRLAWLTGFTGSAGFCVVLDDKAGVFIDGRYKVQVREQVADIYTPVNWPATSAADWIKENLPAGSVVSFDPWMHSVDEIKALEKGLPDMVLRPGENLIDLIWDDQPGPANAPFFAQAIEQSGEDHASKRARLGKELTGAAAILTLPDSIAWLLNIRGSDIERNPVPQAFAILYDTSRVDLFALPGKADPVLDHLGPEVTVRDISGFVSAISLLNGPLQIDPKSAPEGLRLAIAACGTDIVEESDPCALPKACKNLVEVDGAKTAARRDGAAMVRFLAWVDDAAPQGGLTEIDVVTKLEGLRRETNALRDISFETICGVGPHAALPHYRVSDESNAAVVMDDLLLVDSGGQYVDGTTDITRTVIVGRPKPDHIKCYTLVLQGVIALSRARFPTGTTGGHLDSLARVALWSAGLDFDHGTGHGIGSYLSVHEGPQSISGRSTVPLQVGMILSNEPGYYREGDFGIRIENLMVVVPAPELEGADDREMLTFDTLTFVPFDRRLIDTSLLTQAERDWINDYHAQTFTMLKGLVEDDTRRWLSAACAPI